MYAYLLFEARGGSAGQPLLLFLHGSGECGTELEKVKTNGPPKLFPRFGLDRFSVVAPQCPDESGWEPARLATFLGEVIEETRADAGRIYVTGLSMGGTGAPPRRGNDPVRRGRSSEGAATGQPPPAMAVPQRCRRSGAGATR
jgi:predicted peptidase